MIDNNNSTQKLLADFLKVVKQDPELKTILAVTLSFDSKYRKAQLDTLIVHPKLKNTPEELALIFSYLLDDVFAREVQQYLEFT